MRPFKILPVILVIPAIGFAQVSGPVDQDAVPGAVYRSTTDLVALTVTVTDSRQQPIPGLNASDFVVLEDGVRQDVSFFAAGEVPLDITLLVDASASMRDKLDTAREAVRGLTRRLRPTDRISVIEFRESVVQRQEMTDNRGAIESALNAMTAQGGTALYNAMYVALSGYKNSGAMDSSVGAPVRRQTIVVLTDGQDTRSLIGYDDVLEQARRRGVMVYVVALRSSGPVQSLPLRTITTNGVGEGDYAMRSLARETGGQCFFPADAHELTSIYQAISSELGQQYALGYTPRNSTSDGAWRRIVVQLPSRPNARSRTRSGYFAQSAARVLLSRLRSATTH